VYLRNLESSLREFVAGDRSVLIFGPRQTGKTTLVRAVLRDAGNVLDIPLQDPGVRIEMERDPSRLIRQVTAMKERPIVFIDEAQKVPELFDAVQYLIDEEKAVFVLTGSSARKLRRKGTNLLPGRVITFRMDPLAWNELGWISESRIEETAVSSIGEIAGYSFDQSLVYGTLPGIVSIRDDRERKALLRSYAQVYLEEEIRAEALIRKIGAFGRFLELAALESGTSPNLTKLSNEAGVSVPTIKEFYAILEDTLVVERLDPYTRDTRKRVLKTPRYYFYDTGVRNALARVPLTEDLLYVERGRLFEHAVILELIRRTRTLADDCRLYYWRTSGGAEVDCIIDTGRGLVPVEIKAGEHVSLSDVRGLLSFINAYPDRVKKAFVITGGRMPEMIHERIMAIPWQYM